MDPKNGTGCWEEMNIPLERFFEAAAAWKEKMAGVDKPWLCWNVSHRWCELQQRLVQSVGWTPVVGFDPRVGPPPVLSGSILIDFNEGFNFPVLWMHFPMEFVFLWANRLAFWHSDLLCRLPVMEQLAKTFESLEDGQVAAVPDYGGRRNFFKFKSHRYWEICGCTTRAASENQFYNGTGWWRAICFHPKCALEAERRRRRKYYWDDHGVGIKYWERNYHGSIVPVGIHLIKEGHCGMRKNYKIFPNHKNALRSMKSELDANYDIEEVARKLGIEHLL